MARFYGIIHPGTSLIYQPIGVLVIIHTIQEHNRGGVRWVKDQLLYVALDLPSRGRLKVIFAATVGEGGKLQGGLDMWELGVNIFIEYMIGED